MILAFDTETSGKADFKLPPEDHRQPRLVQLGCALYDDVGQEESYVNLLVQANGATYQAEAVSKHGITPEVADKFGVPLIVALQTFQAMVDCADTVVAHNYAFDKMILHGELSRMWQPLHIFLNRPHYCTMLGMMDVCKLPGGYGGEYKWPKLEEAYRHAFGENLAGAHDALADVRACARIYFWMKSQGLIKA